MKSDEVTYPIPPRHDGPGSELEQRLEKMARINAALMQRVERSMDQQANAYSLFQTAIGLEGQVRVRTDQLKTALDRLEDVNSELTSARDAAERANRFKTRFFTAVGHDLLQPLHAARLTLSAMLDGERDREQQRLGGQVDHALSSIEELLKTILDLLVSDLAPIARAKGLRLSHRPTRLMVRSDPLMLRRIVQNLVANAVHYTEKGRIRLLARRRGLKVRLEIWDTGPGIPPAERDRIFEEFQRGTASETARVGGFGLGLSIVQRMSEALEHDLNLCSLVGHGSCFTVTTRFSTMREMQRAPEPVVAPGYGLPVSNVLVIDNEPTVVEAMRALLTRWGCTVRVAASAEDVDALFSETPDYSPDIVLADYHLNRGQTGVAVVSDLRSRLGLEVPAIVISADRSLTQASLAASGTFELLRKPVKPAELRALMLHVMANGA
ncbi:MAG: hybrid sensor histidine kinase/response regulator [Hyphomicrobium sp. 32-62-53]|nr:MAG: hybrid sensor histidine kinase/response regulator [Hyphomicrobium sp. 32-62-53]